MSDQLLYFFLADPATKTDDESPELKWKVVLRTGTWKLRPGPGGVKLKEPLRIYRDKAPKGHISMSSLVKNFEAKAKENVTTPVVHADGTISDSGFVRKLVIQDVFGEDGSKATQSLLWAGIEITDSEVKRKVDEKSLVGVSGGILFDYERTEDAKKFDQVLSHVMFTNSPWIGGTGGFTDKLPDGVMAADEPTDLPIGELELDAEMTSKMTGTITDLPDPTKSTVPPGEVVWKPEEGYQFARGKVQKALDEWRRQLLASLPKTDYSYSDYPYYHVEDISGEGDSRKAMICSGYGSEKEAWVAGFKLTADSVEIDPFMNWTSAKQEWVAASEDPNSHSKPPVSARPAGQPVSVGPVSLQDAGLREAQAARAEHLKLGQTNPTITGGPMGRITDLLPPGIELSDEQREAVRREEERVAALEASEERNRATARELEANTYLTELAVKLGYKPPDGETDAAKSLEPSLARYVRSVILSDDGGPAIELSEETDSGKRTAPVGKTASEIMKGLIDALPVDGEGKVSLSQQARRLPDDPKPPETNDDKPKDATAAADQLAAEFASAGLDASAMTLSQNGGN